MQQSIAQCVTVWGKSESMNANARVPKGRNSLAQHGAAGGVLGRIEIEPEPRRGGTDSFCAAG